MISMAIRIINVRTLQKDYLRNVESLLGKGTLDESSAAQLYTTMRACLLGSIQKPSLYSFAMHWINYFREYIN